MPEVIRWIVTHLPSEAVLVVTVPSGSIICASPRAQALLDAFGSGAISNAVQQTTNGPITRKFQLLSPTFEENYLGWAEVDLKFTAKSITHLPMIRLVSIERIPEYDDLVQELEIMSYIAETLPKGIALHRMTTSSSSAESFVYVSARFGELIGATVEELQSSGLAVNCQIHPDDIWKLHSKMFPSMKNCGECTLSMRVKVNDVFTWRKFATRSSKSEGDVVMTSITVEEVTEEEALDDEIVGNGCEQSAGLMLSAFLAANFDVSFYVDSEFRIIGDTPQIRSFFRTDKSLEHVLINTLIALEEDRIRFQDLMVRPMQTSRNTAIVPMIRLRFSSEDVELYVCPTYLHKIEEFDSGSIEQEGAYLVAVRILKDTKESTPSLDTQPAVAETTPAEDEFVNYTASSRRQSSCSRFVLSSVAEEDSDNSSGKSTDSQALSAEEGSQRLSSSRGIMLGYALQRFLSRDLFHSLLQLDHTRKPCGKIEWLTPYYDIADFVVMEEELVRSLPSSLQGDFVRASRQGIHAACSQLLAFTVEGNANILQQGEVSSTISDNADFIHCVYRFFVGLVPQLHDSEDVHKLLKVLEQAIEFISPTLGRSGTEVVVLEFTMTLITAALRRPGSFASPACMRWLRSIFAEAFKLPKNGRTDKTRRMPTMYHVCVLWASLMNILDRTDEARVLLESIQNDMEQYCVRHPESIAVRQLQAAAVHNLAVMHLNTDDTDSAISWIYKLHVILQVSHVVFPQPCHVLVHWAIDSQA